MNLKNKKIFILVVVSIFTISVFFTNRYFSGEYKVKNNEILLGQSCALSGSAKALGVGMQKGALSYFEYINSKGGIGGNKITLLTKDDKYEPKNTIQNINQFIEKDVFAIFGVVGTPTTRVALPITLENNLLYLTPFTGAELLRKPFNKNIINFRNSYYSEMEALVEYVTSDLNLTKIAVFYQNDSYGKAGLKGVKLAMKKRKLEILIKSNYKRNTLSITNALNEIGFYEPEVVIMVGAYKPCAEFIKRAKKTKDMNKSIFANISFVGSKALVKTLEYKTDNVIISQVVPLPWDNSNKLVDEYQKLFKLKYPNDDYDFVSLEGFISAKIFVEGLKNIKTVTRDNFINALENLDKDVIDGLEIDFNKTNHQASNKVYLTNYKDNKFNLLKIVDIK